MPQALRTSLGKIPPDPPFTKGGGLYSSRSVLIRIAVELEEGEKQVTAITLCEREGGKEGRVHSS